MAVGTTISQCLNDIISDKEALIAKLTNPVNDSNKGFELSFEGTTLKEAVATVSAISSYNPGPVVVGVNDAPRTFTEGYYKAFTISPTNATSQLQQITHTLTEDDLSNGITFQETGNYAGIDYVEILPAKQFLGYKDAQTSAENVKQGVDFVDSTGAISQGTMPDNGGVTLTLDTTTTSYTIPEGYHDGSGAISISLEEKESITPSESPQTITPSDGKVLSKVTVNAIPDNYVTAKNKVEEVVASGVTADQVIAGEKFIDSTGSVSTGTMTNNENWNGTIDGLNTTSIMIPAGYHAGNGTVSLTDDILTALQAI